jgi:UDP-glucuronate decarboxylase
MHAWRGRARSAKVLDAKKPGVRPIRKNAVGQPSRTERMGWSSRVVVTGGAGFIGSHLCARLAEEEYEVVCVDNFSTGRLDNVAQLVERRNFKVLRHDITTPLELAAQEIFNLACPASPVHYQADPIHTLKTCIVGGLNLLELARRNGARIFQASTSEIYGEPNVHPQPESYRGNVSPTGVRACYDEGKRAAETLFFDYHRQHGVRIKVGRIFNTYGPRMGEQDGRVVPNFIVQALQNEPITIYGDGTQTRCFCYVGDLIEGIMRLMRSDERITGPINLGSAEEITVVQLAETILDLTGSRSKLILRPLPSDDPSRRRPDTEQARRELHWQPVVDLHAGLVRTIAYFDALLRAGQPRPADKVALSA